MIVFSEVTVHRDREERLRQLNDKLASLAHTDGLTGLVNRHSFDIALGLAASSRSGVDLSLLMLDVDHFKAFNDGYGHPEGDICLRRVANALAEVFAPVRDAVVARYGGEEFAVILPSIELKQALAMAAIACAAVRGIEISHDFSDKGIVTVSVGVATTIHANVPALLKAADTALYVAKGAGRDCVRSQDPKPVRMPA